MNLATNTISRYETGKREPKLETWNKLAEYFSVPTSYLMGTDDLKFPTNKKQLILFIKS